MQVNIPEEFVYGSSPDMVISAYRSTRDSPSPLPRGYFRKVNAAGELK